MAFRKLLAVLVLIHSTAGLLGAEVRSSIVGGQDAQKGDWPAMAIIHLISEDGTKLGRCGATILNKLWLLTAAECFKRSPAPSLRRSYVNVGVHELDVGYRRTMGINAVIPKAEYQSPDGGNNIALVKLKKPKTPIEFNKEVQPVGLPSVDDTFGPSSECWISGWGNTAANVKLKHPQRLQQLKVPLVSDSDCKVSYPGMTSDMLCAGYTDGGKDACEGDHGGPLMCRAAGGGGFVQVGITSYGSCGLQGRPGVYTKVSKHLRFINDYIHHEEGSAEM